LLVIARDELKKIRYFLQGYGRELDRRLFDFLFINGSAESVIEELEKYQNLDGGFGNGLEPDFKLPDSSPMATTVAFQYIENLGVHHGPLDEIVAKAIAYFDKTFVPDRAGWYAVPGEVNNFPHTPWWHFVEDEGMCAIDKNWGNPTAEIIGYLNKYRQYSGLDVESITSNAISYFNSVNDFNSFHEVFCFVSLHNLLDSEKAGKLEPRIFEAVDLLTSKDEDEWQDEYVAKPLDFARDSSRTFGISPSLIDRNLDCYVDTLQKRGKIKPSWSKSFYDGELASSWDEWILIGTVRALLALERHGRIIG